MMVEWIPRVYELWISGEDVDIWSVRGLLVRLSLMYLSASGDVSFALSGALKAVCNEHVARGAG